MTEILITILTILIVLAVCWMMADLVRKYLKEQEVYKRKVDLAMNVDKD